MRSIIAEALSAFSNIYSGWILWNSFLAFIPLVLSFWLFRRKNDARSLLWWIGLITFIAFLPNAPYVLTDIIHLIRGTRVGDAAWIIALVFVPLHLIAILGGFEAYVIALINQGTYLKRQGAKQLILWSELATHALCAIGIYLGRFRRLNSWDLVTDPSGVVTSAIDDLTNKRPLLVILVTFLIITVFYWLMKQISLGLILRIRYARQGIDALE
jgi:uncharacterized membrane protein